MKEVISGIYGLLDPVTEELRYVGCSADINVRLINHYKIQTCLKYKNTYLHNWLRSLNQRPKLIIIEETSNLEECETFWIAYFRSLGCRLVNTTNGGEGIKGYKFSQEQRKMISERTKLGMNTEVRQRLSEKKKGNSPGNSIKVIDENGIIYNSLKEAANKINCTPGAIVYHLKHNTKSINGFKFKKVS